MSKKKRYLFLGRDNMKLNFDAWELISNFSISLSRIFASTNLKSILIPLEA